MPDANIYFTQLVFSEIRYLRGCTTPRAPVKLLSNNRSSFFCFIFFFAENATRWCDEFGNWNRTNYKECRELETTDSGAVGSAVIYYTGYSISLIALSIAVFIFVHYR